MKARAIFVDSNIPMYLIGTPHPHKAHARRLLDEAVSRNDRLITNAEALREILHRYAAIGRREEIQSAIDVMLEVTDEVLPIDLDTVERAKTIVQGYSQLSARDAIHLATMKMHGIARIMSFDTGFDGFAGIERLH